MSIDSIAVLNPIPATKIDPVMAPVMIIGKPIHTIDTEKVLRRAWAGTGLCSYSSPSTCSTSCSRSSSTCSIELFEVIMFLLLYMRYRLMSHWGHSEITVRRKTQQTLPVVLLSEIQYVERKCVH